jgi:AcrR family transcriptional regulator
MKATGDISSSQCRSQMGGMLGKRAGEGIEDSSHVRAGGSMTQQQREPLRTDAQQNRERILVAAHEALAVSSDASLNSIAKMAGVGPGTLYRHFPNREALVLAVYRLDVQQLADSAPDLLKQYEPVTALRLWFDRLAHYGRIKHGLADVLHAATSDGLAGETYGPVIGAISLLLKACEQAGRIQPGVDPDDVLLLMGFLWRIDANEDGEARAARLLDLVMNGLVTGAPASKPIARRRWAPWPRGQRTSHL